MDESVDFSLHKSIAQRILDQAQEDIAMIENSETVPSLKTAQRYRVMQSAFNEIIEESKAYKDILKEIKMSYDEFFEYMEGTSYNSITLSSKLKNMAARPATLANLKKRGGQLEENVIKLREQNSRLKDELLELDAELNGTNKPAPIRTPEKFKELLMRRTQLQTNNLSAMSTCTKPESSRENVKTFYDNVINGVDNSLEEEKLVETLKKMTTQLDSLRYNKEHKFISKIEHEQYWDEYSKKSEQKSLLENTYHDLQKEYYLISVANTAAKNYLESEPAGKTIAGHVYDTLVDAFKRSLQQLGDEWCENILEDNEAASIISHVEHFHILFDEKRYEQAAWHAAQSPKGVLRNYETFKKFKEAQENNPDDVIMYHYAKAYMYSDSSVEFSTKYPNEEMCIDFVRAMVRAGDQKLVYQWFQNGFLNTSKQLADLLACDKHSKIHGTVVAENIYMRLGLYHDAIRCMAFRGDIPGAISFAQETAGFKREDYIDLLLSVPSAKLARALSVQKYPNTNQVLLPCGQVALLLLKDINVEVAGEFLKTLDLTPPLGQHLTTDNRGQSEIALAPNCIFSDKETSHDDWLHIVKQLEHTDYEDIGIDIVTAISVNSAFDNIIMKK